MCLCVCVCVCVCALYEEYNNLLCRISIIFEVVVLVVEVALAAVAFAVSRLHGCEQALETGKYRNFLQVIN